MQKGLNLHENVEGLSLQLYLKKVSITGVFLQLLKSLSEQFFYRIPWVDKLLTQQFLFVLT